MNMYFMMDITIEAMDAMELINKNMSLEKKT
jgi:hypothetical protein